jgi:hypothetical protein
VEAAARELPAEVAEEWLGALPSVDSVHAARFAPEDLLWDGSAGNPEDDPLMQGLRRLGLVKERRGAGQFEITCPFLNLHTGRADNGTARMPNGGIACHHGHCVGRSRSEYAARVSALLMRARKDDAESQRLARALAPWKPRPYDAGNLRTAKAVLNDARERAAALKPGDVRSDLARIALMMAPLIKEGKWPAGFAEAQVAEALEGARIPVSQWHTALKWALSVTEKAA